MALSGWSCTPQAYVKPVEQSKVDDEVRRQQEMAVRDYLDMLDKLDRVAFALRSKNADLCGEMVFYRLGLNLAEQADYPPQWHETIAKTMGLREWATIFQITQGGPAQLAGIEKGDVLLAVDGSKVTTKSQANAALLRTTKNSKPVTLLVERDGVVLKFVATPVKVCGYDIFLRASHIVNAVADGTRITVFTGMLRFCRTDNELAAIIGHEMAHNVMGHHDAQDKNRMVGRTFDTLFSFLTGVPTFHTFGTIGRNVFSQEFEAEADYVGLYFSARAGFDIANVPDIWRRMAVENPDTITMGASHPTTSQRFVALEAARVEIEQKRATGVELLPDMKGGKPFRAH